MDQRLLRRVVAVSIVAMVVAAAPARSQRPTVPDTARKSDSVANKPPVTLPAMRTEAPRVERKLFETLPNISTLSITAHDLGSAPRFFAEADVLRAL